MGPVPAPSISPVSESARARARAHQDQLTKPPGSLGRLEAIAAQLAAIQGRVAVEVHAPRLCLFAADHGVTRSRGVSPYPRTVTGQMIANILAGGAAVNALSRAAEVELELIDAGVDADAPAAFEGAALSYVHAPVARGTRDFLDAPAMTASERAAALELGEAAAARAAQAGSTLVALGELGIGNTTSAAAITAALTGRPPREVVGPGTGLDAEGLARKVAVVEAALARHELARDTPLASDDADAAVRVLERVGGLELAALVGFCLGAARRGLAVVVDGFITAAAAAVAATIEPALLGYLFAAHRSAEPGHRALLERLGLRPLLELDMRLGEGTGALVAIPLIRAAAAAQREMATFAEAAVDERGAVYEG